jgi:hypothetical protein
MLPSNRLPLVMCAIACFLIALAGTTGAVEQQPRLPNQPMNAPFSSSINKAAHADIASSPALPFPYSALATAEPRDIVLIYCGFDSRGPRNWTADKLKYYAAFWKHGGTPNEQPVDILFDTFLFMYRISSRKHLFEESPKQPSTDKLDWEECLDRIFHPTFQLAALNRTLEDLGPRLHHAYRANVIFTLPHPSVLQKDFGRLETDGPSLNFARSESDRLAALKWYIDEALKRWHMHQFPRLRLIGFYWFNETHRNSRSSLQDIPASLPSDDLALMRQTARYIHSKKVDGHTLTLSWIPYNPYASTYLNVCEQLLSYPKPEHMDYLMIQPNYFFPRWKKTIEDLRNTIQNARKIGAGIEIEFDNNLFKDSALQQRFHEYLDQVQATGKFYRNTYIGYYQGLDTVYRMATDPSFSRFYERLYDFIRGRRTHMSSSAKQYNPGKSTNY